LAKVFCSPEYLYQSFDPRKPTYPILRPKQQKALKENIKILEKISSLFF